MLRAGTLTLMIFCLVAVTVPLSHSLASWPGSAAYHHRHHHSRAWWRRHRARLRRRRALAEQSRRALNGQSGAADAHAAFAPSATDSRDVDAALAPAILNNMRGASNLPLPASWSMLSASEPGVVKFNVRAADGRAAGMAMWTRLANSVAADPSVANGARGKALGGVPFALLRHRVVMQMLAEGGWVVNDAPREIGGRRAFVVFAQNNAANGARQALTYYFTEVEGRIYSLKTVAPMEAADALAADTAQALTALNSRVARATTAVQAMR